MSIRIGLSDLNVKNYEDQLFSYDILKYRWQNAEKQQIKYKSTPVIPTFNEHVSNIQSTRYKSIYKITIGKFAVGTLHVNTEDMVGIFFLPSLLKKALRFYKNNNIKIDIDYISAQAFIELYKKHPNINIFYASVNPTNTLSMNALKRHGFEINEIIFAMKTKNGHPAQGPWQHE